MTKEQTNWEVELEEELGFVLEGEVFSSELSGKKIDLVKQFISKTISQEKEKWAKKKRKELREKAVLTDKGMVVSTVDIDLLLPDLQK